MRKRTAVVAAVVVAAAVAALNASAAHTSASSRSVTMHLVEKQIGFNFVDNPPRQGHNAAPLMGDQFAFASELLKSGKHAGDIDATCTITRGGEHGFGTCYGTFLLKGGQLAVIASIDLARESVNQIAIVGGTGAYEGVRGSIASRSRGENSPFSDDTVHLIFP